MRASSTAFPTNTRSVIQPTGVNPHKCGYCSSSHESSLSYGVISPRMTITDYEQLMLQGWRRCGTYFYVPLMHATCCPMYSIRLPVNAFNMSKSQKKVLKNVQKKLHAESAVNIAGKSKKDSESEKPQHQAKKHKLESLSLPSEKETETETAEDPIAVTIEPASFSAEKFSLYRRYQVAVHGDAEDEVSEDGFTSFLVTSPLVDQDEERDSQGNRRYGSFHHCYRLHGELIAVGVVDVLPSGLSSVYCFYTPDRRDLAIGKYTALKEIEWCQRHGFAYYYMGYYIHNCAKMKYKGEYAPSQLLCPATLRWFDLKESASLLEKHKFTPLEPQCAKERESVASDDDEAALRRYCFDFKIHTDVHRIALRVNANRVGFLSDLTSRGVQAVQPILEEMVTYIPADVCYRVVVKLW